MSRLIVAPLLVALTAPAFAQDEYNGRIRYLEPGILLQRAGESGTEEALANMPFLPGDRLWSDETGRAELQFAGAAQVRLDSRGKLDYVSHDAGRRNDRILMRLWSGGLYFHVRDGRSMPDFELETPAGLVELLDRGVYRVDVASGETRLSVIEGQAAIESGGRRVHVDSGERSYAQRDEEPDRPAPFDAYEEDEFASWDRGREDQTAYAGDSERYLPEDLGDYGGELESAGSWYYESEVGHVWRPYVSSGWRPYMDGHWTWTVFGWTWVPYEPWGWATSHYGRWDFSPVLGWYWIPGGVWGPAWVSWAVGGDYVGWCPLGYGDRPVGFSSRVKGYAVPRGSTPPAGAGTTSAAALDDPGLAAYNFVRKADMGSRRLVDRRFAVQGEAARAIRVAESPRALTRELKLGEAPAASLLRPVKTRPSFGDTVPELRSDPATTIPLPIRRREAEDDVKRDYATRPEVGRRPTDLRSPREPAPASRQRDAAPELWRPGTALERSTRPTDQRSPRKESTAPRERDATPPARRSAPQQPSSWLSSGTPRAQEQGDRDRNEATPPSRREPAHDVLKRFFQPASEGRSRGESSQGSTQRSEPRPTTPPRVEPRGSAPKSTPAPKQESPRSRPKKEKDN